MLNQSNWNGIDQVGKICDSTCLNKLKLIWMHRHLDGGHIASDSEAFMFKNRFLCEQKTFHTEQLNTLVLWATSIEINFLSMNQLLAMSGNMF